MQELFEQARAEFGGIELTPWHELTRERRLMINAGEEDDVLLVLPGEEALRGESSLTAVVAQTIAELLDGPDQPKAGSKLRVYLWSPSAAPAAASSLLCAQCLLSACSIRPIRAPPPSGAVILCSGYVDGTPPSWPEKPAPFSSEAGSSAIIVLGNQPIDGFTPTVDVVHRVKHAVDLYRKETNNEGKAARRRCVLLFTGGDGTTTGKRGLTEATMMSLLALR